MQGEQIKNEDIAQGTYFVYIHTSPFGKRYIGITGRDPRKRWKNGCGYQRSSHFYNAIKKYGWESFTHEIVLSGVSKLTAELMEIGLISWFDSSNPEFGYNRALGGGLNSGWMQTEEAKRKIGEASVKRERKEESFFKMSKTRRERYPHKAKAKGESRYLYSDENYQNSVSFNKNQFGKRVRCVETGMEYETMRDAETATGASHQGISLCVRGKAHIAGGYHWRYAE